MPSGLEIVDLGQESNCLECHQGRASSLHVAEMIADHPKDEVKPDLSIPNIHANAVGATFYGTQAKGVTNIANINMPPIFIISLTLV
jgi:hypothetical protein